MGQKGKGSIISPICTTRYTLALMSFQCFNHVMKILDGKRIGSVTVFEDTLLLAEVIGDVILNSGHLELKGKILGNLYVR